MNDMGSPICVMIHRMRSFAVACLVVWLVISSAVHAQDRRVEPVRIASVSQHRVALVIGNAAYPASPLHNGVNDAQSLVAVLRELGFQVQVALNTDLRTLDRSVNTFVSSLHAGDVALFYYSGHGLQVDGENYVVPVDFHAEQQAEVPYQAYSAMRVLERMQESGVSLSLLILDACRDNPFRAARSASKGLAAMNSGKGSFIAFATAPGATAGDNPGESNGLFTKHLLAALSQPDLKLNDLFDHVREQVFRESSGKQLPWTASSVIGTFVFRDLDAMAVQVAAERARLEGELKELERQRIEAERQRNEREQAEKEKEAAGVRELLRLQQAEQERIRQELQQRRARLTEMESEAARERREKEEETKLAELRRKRDEEEARLAGLTRGSMSLEEARQQAASLEAKVVEISKSVHGQRDQALQQLEADWEPKLKEAQRKSEKGMFETTAQYQARLQVAESTRKELEKQYHAERAGIEKRYSNEQVSEAAAHYTRQLEELKSGSYVLQGAKVEFVGYDADHSRLTARVNDEEYDFRVGPEKAQRLYDSLSSVRVEMAFSKFSNGGRPSPKIELLANGERFRMQTYVNPGDGQRYVWIPAGTFQMGCSASPSECFDDEKPPHQVTIARGFWMGRTLVTQAAYRRVEGENPSVFHGGERPVDHVQWKDAIEYCAAIGMRLPTEAEWEYAARAGSSASRYGDIDVIAWYAANSGNTPIDDEALWEAVNHNAQQFGERVKKNGNATHPVSEKAPNAWNLSDMLGNVWQWTADWYGANYYAQSPPQDPRGPTSGTQRVTRGGSYWDRRAFVRLDSRSFSAPEESYSNLGFRCAGQFGDGDDAPSASPTPPPVPMPTPAITSVRSKVNSRDGLTYVWIQAGTFQMGCSPHDAHCWDDEKPAHPVKIRKGFWLGQTLVTQVAYQRVKGTNPSHSKGDQRPVESVTWDDAVAYCSAVGMRLPTGAEWEYAARAGSTASRYGDPDAIGWHLGNSYDDAYVPDTHDVAQKRPNAWKLYDMLGNVWEWTADWYYENDHSQGRAVRGGSWNTTTRSLRVSNWVRAAPESRFRDTGFRCAGDSLP